MQGRQTPSASHFGDVSRQTMRVMEIIAAWVVNTFYNYLHQEAVSLHTNGRVGSITDGYRYIVKQYLDSFNSAEGYKRLVISLHKYYVDNSHCAAIAFDEWTREVLEQFVPLDYKAIMSNEQQDILLRNILINAIEQFSSDVLCTRLLDLLISNHDEPSIAPQMKVTMKSILLAERQKIFNNIHRASTGADSGPQMTIKREICALIEENVILKSKNGKLTESVKKSLEGMKMRDKAISVLKTQIGDLQRQIQQLHMQIPQPLYVQPRTQAEEFKSSIANMANAAPLAPLKPILRPREPSTTQYPREVPVNRPPASLPSYMVKDAHPEMRANSHPEFTQGRYADRQNPTRHQANGRVSDASYMIGVQDGSIDTKEMAMAAPLSHLEKTPEPFEQADPGPEPEHDVTDQTGDIGTVATGNDTLELNMDEFMNS